MNEKFIWLYHCQNAKLSMLSEACLNYGGFNFYFVIDFFATGVVVAVCGQEEKDGEFFVREVLEAGLPLQSPLPSFPTSGQTTI